MKSVLIDCHIFDKNYQGIRTFLQGIILELINSHEVEVILCANNLEGLRKIFGDHKSVQYVHLVESNGFLRLMYYIPRLIRQKHPDFALFNYTVPILKLKGCKYINIFHDVLYKDFPEYFPWRYRMVRILLARISLKFSDHILTVSKYSMARINHHFGLNLSINQVIPNGVGLEFVQGMSKVDSLARVRNHLGLERFFLYVSRIEPRKNHDLLLKWYREGKYWNQGLQLVFVGKYALSSERKYKYQFQTLTDESDGFFRHFPQIDKDLLLDLYNSAELFVFPSLCEGFGIPPLEAASMRTPVLTSNLTAMVEYDFFKEYHLDPQIDNFSEMLSKIADKGNLTGVEQIENNANFIFNNYNWKIGASKLMKIINEESRN